MPHDDTTAPAQAQRLATWPLWLLALPAGVAIWSGWVGLGEMTGFGPVTLLPGISDFEINTAVTLPIGMEAYAAYALRAWLSGRLPVRAERFARRSAIGALALGAAGQAFYHLLASSGVEKAPWPLTVFVSVLPVLVLGMGAALAHLINTTPDDTPSPSRVEEPQAATGDKVAENIPARIPAAPAPSTSSARTGARERHPGERQRDGPPARAGHRLPRGRPEACCGASARHRRGPSREGEVGCMPDLWRGPEAGLPQPRRRPIQETPRRTVAGARAHSTRTPLGPIGASSG